MYTPSSEILKKYADVLIKFALHNGKGVQPGETVYLVVPECAKPILVPLQTAVLEAGAFPLIQYLPDGVSKPFFEVASDEQNIFCPKPFYQGLLKQVDHYVRILAEEDKHELEGIDAKKIMENMQSKKFWRDNFFKKVDQEQAWWTLGLYGTPAMAKEVELSEEEYWDQIIKACFLKEVDPIKKWKEIIAELESTQQKLNNLDIKKVEITGENVDLTVTFWEKRKWLTGSGCNIPSFEIFISPDWRGCEGKISFDMPLFYQGSRIEGVSLEVKKGKVISATATKNESLLQEMIAVKDADKFWEFSLTDRDMSKITEFMGETLFDENVGGPYGNMHIAVGMAYKESYREDGKKLKKSDWKKLGFNESAVHTDIIHTGKKEVWATCAGKKEKILIYKDGKFQV